MPYTQEGGKGSNETSSIDYPKKYKTFGSFFSGSSNRPATEANREAKKVRFGRKGGKENLGSKASTLLWLAAMANGAPQKKKLKP